MQPLTVTYEHGELLAVPAVHFSHVFAWEVNRLCTDPETRPEAIAVELGPQTAAAVAEWLKELSKDPVNRKPLPLMLGLTRTNRMIRAALKDKAARLQRQTGNDLSELPPRLLFDELGYTGASLICLCPTDSLIEAARCAIELRLPLYGVDIEETADGKYPAVMIQDPLSANGDLAGYVARNATYAERQRDEEIDRRREIAMAARLKALLRRHRRVLFTCGLAHWRQIRSLLEDPSIRPALLPESAQSTGNDLKRVVIHPLLAIRHMDVFPALALAYEKQRTAVKEAGNPGAPRCLPDALHLYSTTLRKANRKYFRDGLKKRREHTRDLDSLAAFESYLKNMAVLHCRTVPDLFMTTLAARGTMSDEFVNAVVNGFMDIPWVSPEKFPDCALLMPAAGHDGGPLAAVYGHNGYLDKDPVFIRSLPNRGRDNDHVNVPFAWTDTKKVAKFSKTLHTLHTWAPWDNVITSLSLRAIDRVDQRRPRKTVEIFEGSLLEGIDIKATLRAFSRGREDIMVRNASKIKAPSAPQTRDGFPVVWLLDPKAKMAEWIAMFVEFSSMAAHVRHRVGFNHLMKTQGSHLVATIGFGKRAARGRGSLKNARVRSDRYFGITLFQPLCWSNRQFARWAELTDYARNPVCRDSILNERISSDMKDFFATTHGIQLGEFHWSTTLILFAIPFARGVLPVVVPDDYTIAPVALEKARSCGVEIAPVPLSHFSQAELERLSISQMVPVRTTEPKCVYPAWVTKETGEQPTDFLDWVPRSWLDFGV